MARLGRTTPNRPVLLRTWPPPPEEDDIATAYSAGLPHSRWHTGVPGGRWDTGSPHSRWHTGPPGGG
jgi:hypothetical protein